MGRGAAPPSRRGAAGPGIAGERGLPPCPGLVRQFAGWMLGAEGWGQGAWGLDPTPPKERKRHPPVRQSHGRLG